MSVRLVGFTVAALDAEGVGATELCAVLGVSQPVDWPPPFSDRDVRHWFRAQLLADPALAPWLGSHVIAPIDCADTVVGTAGYKGPPDAAGRVDIGYALITSYRRRGIGTQVVRMLATQAFADARVSRIVAETPGDFVASRGLLEKSGFQLSGWRTDPEDGTLAVYVLERG
ncbi:GNAT family N-acetyltransferase [Devosia sp.]|jgi:ribosomal-protein-alanine N-acetyltransferase|uniref:GNAT family N-acetyltransferase n=1 Tax=Devosia sp. TaxID=1871048 RepID=UPI0037BFCEE3